MRGSRKMMWPRHIGQRFRVPPSRRDPRRSDGICHSGADVDRTNSSIAARLFAISLGERPSLNPRPPTTKLRYEAYIISARRRNAWIDLRIQLAGRNAPSGGRALEERSRMG